jgi:hypothetical protein
MNKELDFKLIESDWLLINYNTKPKIIYSKVTRNKKKKKILDQKNAFISFFNSIYMDIFIFFRTNIFSTDNIIGCIISKEVDSKMII